MEELSLRVILLIVGVFLIIGIYLWDKRKHVDDRLLKRFKSRQSPAKRRRRDKSAVAAPSLSVNDASSDDILMSDPVGADQFPEDFSLPMDEVDGLDEADNQLSFTARNAFQEFEAGADLPTRIIQLNLLAKDHQISGNMIMDVAADLNLQHGEFNIFHRIDQPTGKAVFSMANAVEPGNFDLTQMENFSTPGLTLFARLPAPVDSMKVFEEMLQVCQRVSFIVGAEMQDASHCTLTTQSIEHEREQVRQYQRQLDMAMQNYN